MPKLSQYVQNKVQRQTGPPVEPAITAQLSQLAADQQNGNSATPGRVEGSSQAGATGQQQPVSARLKEAYAKRLREHGPRLYRWPDGSLQPLAPLPSPNATANRRKWEPLVGHCRTRGGDRAFASCGQSLRYGINVTPAEHAAYLQQAGLVPEALSGVDRAAANPLLDPHHALNSFYKEAAAEVFKGATGRLL